MTFVFHNLLKIYLCSTNKYKIQQLGFIQHYARVQPVLVIILFSEINMAAL